jgi:hypothetical protein
MNVYFKKIYENSIIIFSKFLSLFIVNISLLAFYPSMVDEELSVSPFDNMLMIYAMKGKEQCYYVEFKNFLKLTFLSLYLKLTFLHRCIHSQYNP